MPRGQVASLLFRGALIRLGFPVRAPREELLQRLEGETQKEQGRGIEVDVDLVRPICGSVLEDL